MTRCYQSELHPLDQNKSIAMDESPVCIFWQETATESRTKIIKSGKGFENYCKYNLIYQTKLQMKNALECLTMISKHEKAYEARGESFL